MTIDLEKIKKVYIIGIKGSGVIAIVEILHSKGIEVVGSDTEEKFFTDEILKRNNIKYFEYFSAENIPENIDLVIYSTVYNEENNSEFREVKRRNLPMLSYPQVLAALFNKRYGIAVCGTHGKTTTSGWLANTLKELGVDPGAVIGGRVANWNGNALVGNGEFFVIEADEYQNKLALYDPHVAILTSCDFDHPDLFANFSEYKKVFCDFVSRIPKTGFLVAWGDSSDTLDISASANCQVLTYGFSDDCDYRIINLEREIPTEMVDARFSQTFEIVHKDKNLGKFEIHLIGKHNALNATAVIAVCHKLNQDVEKIREALKTYRGTARRFEFIGTRSGALLFDDYGHHPDEIKPTLKAARELYPEKNIWAVFHPHTFTRTKELLSEFSQSFDDASKVIVLDIYGSARETQGGVHSRDLVELINRYNRDKAEYISTIDEVVEYLKEKIGADDIIIAIGAGNGWEVVDKLKD